MARAHGARAQMALAFETVYGTAPTTGFKTVPFASTTLGSEQPLIASELLGQGRDPPNQHPVLPNPVRPSFFDGLGIDFNLFNPFFFFKKYAMCCGVCCVVLVVVVIIVLMNSM